MSSTIVTLHPAILHVRQRIEQRSSALRTAYLANLPKGPARRDQMGCANLAHVTAPLPTAQRISIAQARAPHIGVITAYNDMLSAHQPFAHYPEQLLKAALAQGATLQVAGGVPAMCDGITQGREGMELSLFSRDLIAMSSVVGLSHDVFDAAILLGVCDKIAPGMLLGALAFGHLPTVFIPAGPMVSGLSNAAKSAVRQRATQGLASRDELLAAEEAAYHASGTCTFYGTANSNQLMLDLMGLQFPGAAFVSPHAPERAALMSESVRALLTGVNQPARRLADVVDARCLVNALVGLLATGGSTNHAIHWIAVARAAGFIIDWDDLDALSKAVPLIARVYPNGPADVNEFHAAGGTAAVGHWLIEAGYMDGSALTAWGSTLADTLGEAALNASGAWAPTKPPASSRNIAVLRKPAEPFAPEGGLRLLAGNLGRSIAKISAVAAEHQVVEAPCAIFNDQAQVIAAFNAGELNRDVVVVVRFQGPQANGMPELHKLTPVLGVLQDQGYRVALVTDGRMSGASGKVLAAIHVCPEAQQAGPLASLRDGDLVRVDGVNGNLSTDAQLHERAPIKAPAVLQTHGRDYFATMRQNVSSAEQGASVLFA